RQEATFPIFAPLRLGVRLLLRDSLEDVDSAAERVVRSGIRHAEVRVAMAEYRTGNDEQVVADGLGDELAAGAPRGFREEVERAARNRKIVTIGETLNNHVALAAILGNPGGSIAIESRDAAGLHHARSANVGELLQLGHLVDQAFGAVGPAEPPAGEAVGLAEPFEDDGLIVECRRAAGRSVVVERAVD